MVGDAEQQVVRSRLLHQVAVQVRADREVGRVEVGGGNELGTEREEAVLPLHAEHRPAVCVAEVVHPDVVRARIARDVRQDVVDRHTLHPPPDDDGQLALVVEKPRVLGHPDRPAVAVQRRGRLDEVGRLGRRPRGVLLHARAIREVDGEDLRRLGRREVESVRLRELGAVLESDRVARRMTPPRHALDLDPNAPLRDQEVRDGLHTPPPPTPSRPRGRTSRRPRRSARPRSASSR